MESAIYVIAKFGNEEARFPGDHRGLMRARMWLSNKKIERLAKGDSI